MVGTAIAVLSLTGCASYSDAVRDAQADVRAGRPDQALVHFDDRLETDGWEELPDDLEGDKVLLLLERATLLQATGEYETSARDMIVADQRLEWLDIDAYDRVDLAKWIYSDDASNYRAPAYERLLLNTLNMVNFLALGDLESARVEARRFELIESFFVEEASEPIRDDLRATGHFLSGAAFEHSGDLTQAVRHYEIAWRMGWRGAGLRQRLVDLYRLSSERARGRPPGDPTTELVVEAELKGAIRLAEYRRRHLDGDTIVVVQSGLSPYRKAVRVPIGRAFIWAGAAHSHHGLSAAERARGQELIAQGLLKWVNLPVLSEDGIQVDPPVSLAIDGRSAPLEGRIDIAAQVVTSWKEIFPPIVASAITRMITRAVAGTATRVTTREIAKNSDSAGGAAIGAVGLLASLAIEGGMAAADTPDTRSWTTLPGAIRLRREQLEPGTHTLSVRVRGRTEERTVEISQRGLILVNFSRLR